MAYVGILGGTFDPLHYGHLAAAQGALHLAGLDRVIFVPNRHPPHKARHTVTPAEHRAAMVHAAIGRNSRFGFSGMELARSGPSYTIDTVRAFQEQQPDWRIAFVAGLDSLVEIRTWKDYRTLLALADLLVVTRPGIPSSRAEAVLADLGPTLARRINILEIPGVDISATDLRRLAIRGYPLRYLVPDSVLTYIEEHRLYAAGATEAEKQP